MGRAYTAIWEEIKSEHTICLCYSESKGLYYPLFTSPLKKKFYSFLMAIKVFGREKCKFQKIIFQLRLRQTSDTAV